MRKLFWSAIILITAGQCLVQEAGQQPNPRPSQDQNSDQQDKQDRKNDKVQADAPDTSVFSDDVASNVLNGLRSGLEGHSQSRMLAAFDRDKMEGYRSFADQIQSFFDQYESFRVHYRIAQSTREGARGVVLVDFEMEAIPRGAGAAPERKSAQLRFELERGRKGWKVVELRPREFFS